MSPQERANKLTLAYGLDEAKKNTIKTITDYIKFGMSIERVSFHIQVLEILRAS